METSRTLIDVTQKVVVREPEAGMEQRYVVKIDATDFDIVVNQTASAPNEYLVTVNGRERNVSLADFVGRASDIHALIDSLSYRAHLERHSDGGLTVVTADGTYDALVENYQLAQLKSRLGVKATKAMSKTLKAPMPGLVLQVNVNEGDSVEAGDTVVVLEAMKMENPIKSVGAGVVRKIHVTARDSVEKGVALIEFAD